MTDELDYAHPPLPPFRRREITAAVIAALDGLYHADPPTLYEHADAVVDHLEDAGMLDDGIVDAEIIDETRYDELREAAATAPAAARPAAAQQGWRQVTIRCVWPPLKNEVDGNERIVEWLRSVATQIQEGFDASELVDDGLVHFTADT